METGIIGESPFPPTKLNPGDSVGEHASKKKYSYEFSQFYADVAQWSTAPDL